MTDFKAGARLARRGSVSQRDAAAAPGLAVADLVCNRLVRLPAWFTVEQARKVVALRGLQHVLVEEHGQVRGLIDRSSLWRMNGADSLARGVVRSAISIAADAPIARARALMLEQAIECMTVVRGGILIGTVALADIDFNLERVVEESVDQLSA